MVLHKRLPLGEGMLDLIKLACEDESTLAAARAALGEQDRVLVEAAKHYLRRLLQEPSSDPYRRLALRPGAPEKAVRDHKRWLLKWLHPDRNPSKWEAQLFAVVNSAAAEVESGAATVAAPPPAPVASKRPSRRSKARVAKVVHSPTRRILVTLAPILAVAVVGFALSVALVDYLSRTQSGLRVVQAWLW